MTTVGIFLRGLAMGAADIVPGVSGGTIAFISGIYPTLLRSIRSVDLAAMKMLLRGDPVGFWRHINGGFLLVLLGGIATSLFSLARLLSWVMEHYPEPLWGFFFGLILASGLVLLKRVSRWRWREVMAVLLGTGVALSIALAPGIDFLPGPAGIFLAGFIAICAMILPGISGSFLLLLLGMYPSMLLALKDFDWYFLGVFLTGAAVGLAVFSRLLHWLLERFRVLVMAVLTGFLLGSLAAIWPWKVAAAAQFGAPGADAPVRQLPASPTQYLVSTGNDPLLVSCLLSAVAGIVLVWWLERKWGQSQA